MEIPPMFGRITMIAPEMLVIAGTDAGPNFFTEFNIAFNEFDAIGELFLYFINLFCYYNSLF